ncbi:unnamed protein product [Rotaria sp. Silwood1]|nr:unnamed protein product [Rotaria sp. Silwood1]CAF4860992.1 unnamed protein product [Rotaria sp. Silwood1]CAF4861002.1 unnamed protein product [Rotaria sp. Silwood1]
MVLSTKGTVLPVLSVRVHPWGTDSVTPTVQQFDSYSELEKFVRDSANPKVLPGVTLFLHFPWLGNIGHTLFDALYPPYAAIIPFPPRHLQPFRLLAHIDECATCWDEDILNRFSGLGIMKHYVLNDMSNGSWFVFDEFVMGGGMMCQRCTQPNLQLPGGVELDGSRLFRDRMYLQYGVIPPVRRYKSSAEGRNRHDILVAYVIDNKRYRENDRREIYAAMEEINNYTIEHQNRSIADINKLDWPLVKVSYIHYYRIGEVHKKKRTRFNATPTDARSPTYELVETFLGAQLRLLRTMDIQITGPGTGAMYQTFLPDGSVVINVGGLIQLRAEDQNITYTSFMEQYMTSGAPYLKGLYYPINDRPKGIKRQQLVKLIREAANLIMNGFSMPVNPRDNLAPDGQLFVELCEKDKALCELITGREPGTSFLCYHSWVEELIHERGPWREVVGSDGKRKSHCPFNRTLMRELRDKYGIIHHEKSVSQSKTSVSKM